MNLIQSKHKVMALGVAALLVFGSSSLNVSAAPAPKAAAPMHFSAAEGELDFELVNKTGYIIKEVSVSPAKAKNWHDNDELLQGREFGDGDVLKITFNPKAQAEHWDLQVVFAGDDDTEEFDDLKLSDISKVTLHYNKGTKETHADIE